MTRASRAKAPKRTLHREIMREAAACSRMKPKTAEVAKWCRVTKSDPPHGAFVAAINKPLNRTKIGYVDRDMSKHFLVKKGVVVINRYEGRWIAATHYVALQDPTPRRSKP